MSNNQTVKEKFAIVVLAAGEGKRMKSQLPKVMHLLNGKPLIAHLVEAIRASGVVEKPVIVVSKKHSLVQEYFGNTCDYVIQEETLGTGHAVRSTEKFLKGMADFVCVFYADHPFVQRQTIQNLKNLVLENQATLTLLTTKILNESGPFAFFNDFGRVLRDNQGRVTAIREKKDCSPAELLIREVNPGFYCFKADWLWQALPRLENKNVQGEYYLTDLVSLAISDQEPVLAKSIDPRECIGINTPEQLALAEEIWQE